VTKVNKDILNLCDSVAVFFLRNENIRFSEIQLKAYLMEIYGFDSRVIAPRISFLAGSGLIQEVSKKGKIVQLNVPLLLEFLEGSEYENDVKAILRRYEKEFAAKKLAELAEAEKEAGESK
jgi:hypothetical protein